MENDIKEKPKRGRKPKEINNEVINENSIQEEKKDNQNIEKVDIKETNIKNSNEDIQKQLNKENINKRVYIKNMKQFYTYEFKDKGLSFFNENRIKNPIDTNPLNNHLFIPYELCGNVYDSFKLFDNFKFKEKGKFKKGFYYFFIFLVVMSVYYNPKNLMFYALVYLVGLLFYLIYTKNKHYLRLNVIEQDADDCGNLIFLFDEHKSKMHFLEEIKKVNDNTLCIKKKIMTFKESTFGALKSKIIKTIT